MLLGYETGFSSGIVVILNTSKDDKVNKINKNLLRLPDI